jgi:single-stranded-DNA-specific exonuclease
MRRPGLQELSRVGGVDPERLTARHLGFVLGPRMNAAGRLEHAERSRRLLEATDVATAAQLAGELNELNARRRQEQDVVFAAADAAAAERADDPVLVLAHAAWSHGVVGIVASKLAEKWLRPVMVGQITGDEIKFSARSSGDFNMIASLRANVELMQRHGGHFFAAGCTVAAADLDRLRVGLARYYHESDADPEPKPRRPDLYVDDLSELNWETLGQLDLLEPFGIGNPPPLFELTGVRALNWRTMGKDGAHLRLTLTDGRRTIGAVGFGMGPLTERLAKSANLTIRGELGKNEYQGNTSLQFQLAELLIEQK